MRLTRGSSSGSMEIYNQRRSSVGGVSGAATDVTYYDQTVVEPCGTVCPVRCGDTNISITITTTTTAQATTEDRTDARSKPYARSHSNEMMPPVTAEARLQSDQRHRDDGTAVTSSSTVRAGPGPRWNVCGRLNRRSQLLHLLLGVTVLLAQLFVNIRIGEAASQILNKAEPLFISRSEAFKFAVGDTITLPCEVASPGSYVLAWKRGIAILTAGTVKVTPDPRVRLVNGYTLQIRDAVPQDAGDYICQMALLDPREITHHVEILVPPKITHVTSGGHLQVRKGSPVRLECSATGNPMPNITWTRKNNLLPNGEEQFTNPVYVIENMDRHKGGTYICTANNGVGQVATSQIILHVLYPPEISVENPIVYSGEGQEAMLVCIVHGESQPEVLWHKDTMQIDQTERHVIENRGARHTLIIRKVHPQDFGNYSCIADNQLGKTRKTVTLTGKPKTAVFRSVPNSQWKDKYNISWIVDSHSPIEEYKLYYRQVDGDTLQTHDGIFIDNRKTHTTYLGDNMLDYNRKISSYDSYAYNTGYHNLHHKWSKTDWRDIVLPAFPYSHHYTQGMSYLIRGLEPDQQYEARVQSRNRYGWSDFSESFLFTTSNTDTEIRDLGVTHYSSSRASVIFTSEVRSMLAALLLDIACRLVSF
ncbi:neural cell adhesion molecule 2-like [Anopheles darlingi]|uniref:neural cell adhesion molecule 2-like n=1 Tax=Anopheles darlingi TaxID=43151 RepID=UPI0021001A14|nr:neural cell adhesion molecule 2-like [Anopheles darlingi]